MKSKFLKITIGSIILILTGFITLTQINFLDYESPISYDKINQITFKNFRGLEFFQNSLYGNKHFAYVKTSIDYEFRNDSIKIQSHFHPSSSYVYNKNAFSKDLLIHEMYHFKITELYVRIAKNKISRLKRTTRNEIKDLIRQVKVTEREFQTKYDDETFHSYVLSEQKKYERNIDSLLNIYTKFKNPKVYINEE